MKKAKKKTKAKKPQIQEEERRDALQKEYQTKNETLMGPIAKIFQENKIKLGLVVVIDEISGTPVPFMTYNGNLMEVAELSKWAFQQLRRKIAERLTLED